MASYHLQVKSVSRSSGRSATAAAAYRSAERIACDREGRVHDFRRKRGVAHTEIVAPDDAPDWVRSREKLWNGAEAAENRKNSVVAREWELALPHELDDQERRELALDFAHELVERYGVVADVAIHLPHRDGDQRNHHAHVLTTTRRVAADGFGTKTRELDVKQKSSIEVAGMRELWAERQNLALERAGERERVDHRSLAAQRKSVEMKRDTLELALRPDGHFRIDAEQRRREHDLTLAILEAAELAREPEVKLGSAVNAIERRAEKDAEAAGKDYEPVTERGSKVYALREWKSYFRDTFDNLKELKGNTVEALRETSLWTREVLWDRSTLNSVEVHRAIERLREKEHKKSRYRSSEKDRARKRENQSAEFRPIQRDDKGRVTEDLHAYLREEVQWRRSREEERGKERDKSERDR